PQSRPAADAGNPGALPQHRLALLVRGHYCEYYICFYRYSIGSPLVTLKKFLSLSVTLAGLSLLIWAGVSIWAAQVNSTASDQSLAPLWQAEPIVPTALPGGLAEPTTAARPQ